MPSATNPVNKARALCLSICFEFFTLKHKGKKTNHLGHGILASSPTEFEVSGPFSQRFLRLLASELQSMQTLVVVQFHYQKTICGQYIFIIIAICQYCCHLLFHFRSGFYYFNLKTVLNCLKLNPHTFNLIWREQLLLTQLLCFSAASGMWCSKISRPMTEPWQHPAWSVQVPMSTDFTLSCWFSSSAKANPLTELPNSLLGANVHIL